jgi:hypothetical protein
MPYTASISRPNPTCFAFLIDQSGSMEEQMEGSARTKAEFIADAINRMLDNLIMRNQRGEEILHRFDIIALGYSGEDDVRSAFVGPLDGRPVASITDIGNMPARMDVRTRRMDDGTGNIISTDVELPVWIDPVAQGRTPMCKAFRTLYGQLDEWISRHPTAFPPVVMHFTDGASTDGDPGEAAAAVRSLASDDGNVVLFNVHVSRAGGQDRVFPTSTAGIGDELAGLLFNMSSTLPEPFVAAAKRYKYEVTTSTRAFAYNAAAHHVGDFLNIGTQPANIPDIPA